jgi:hypothetical protein
VVRSTFFTFALFFALPKAIRTTCSAVGALHKQHTCASLALSGVHLTFFVVLVTNFQATDWFKHRVVSANFLALPGVVRPLHFWALPVNLLGTARNLFDPYFGNVVFRSLTTLVARVQVPRTVACTNPGNKKATHRP